MTWAFPYLEVTDFESKFRLAKTLAVVLNFPSLEQTQGALETTHSLAGSEHSLKYKDLFTVVL